MCPGPPPEDDAFPRSNSPRERLRALARPALDALDRRFAEVHRHLDAVAERLEPTDDFTEVQHLLADTLAELRAQSQATLELAQTLQGFAEALTARLERVADALDARTPRT
jgi:ABC-type transporter Mla subunit MlaD